jgi:capsular exopolysaccharide synthesis family protein
VASELKPVPGGQSPTDPVLRGYLRVLGRRRSVVLVVTLLVATGAVALSAVQERRYAASAKVLISGQSLANELTGTPYQNVDPDRVARTQIEIASLPVVAERVLAALRLKDRTPEELIDDTRIRLTENTDLIDFRVRDSDRELVRALATEYARQYTAYRDELDTLALQRSRKQVIRQIKDLKRRGAARSELIVVLTKKYRQLRTLDALHSPSAVMVRTARLAEKVQPRPWTAGLLGLGLGLLLGVGLAFTWDALDTRVRSPEELEEALGSPLLARLPEPPEALTATHRLVMRDTPHARGAEAFRLLRTNLEFLNLDRGARTIMMASAAEGEGKSTTLANLGVALVQGGHRVALVDLDLRRPGVDPFFGIERLPGLTNVALGHVDLEAALSRIDLATAGEAASANGSGRQGGILEVLPAGPSPPHPAEFIATAAVAEILATLARRADFVLIDVPPLLSVVDAMVLSARVDAVILVARLGVVRRPMIKEIDRMLRNARARTLGFVVTGATESDDDLGYMAYGYLPAAPEIAARA